MNHKLPAQSRLCRTRQTKNYLGFSLIELLVVVAIFATVGTIVVQMFFSSLKGGSKSNILSTVKQNGDYALTVMERMIRNSKEVVSCGPNNLRIKDYNQQEIIFSCSGTRIASASGQPLKTYFLTSDSVAVTTCPNIFTCQLSENKIGVNFTVTEDLPGARIEERAQMDFKTTVTLRNY